MPEAPPKERKKIKRIKISVPLSASRYAASVPGHGIVVGRLSNRLFRVPICSVSICMAIARKAWYDTILLNETDGAEIVIISATPREIANLLDRRGLVLRRDLLNEVLPLLLYETARRGGDRSW